MTEYPPTSTYTQFSAGKPSARIMRDLGRDLALRFLVAMTHIDRTGNWIRFPYYHHVFEDEQIGFERHLTDLANLGDFISIDDAVGLIQSCTGFDGRYFCISFDDGFQNCFAGAFPILAARKIPGVFYIATDFVGTSLTPDEPERCAIFDFNKNETAIKFLDWDECRAMSAGGMTIGSHSCTHSRLVGLTDNEMKREFETSRAVIESELGTECLHFCAPYGIPGTDFDLYESSKMARDAGYESFATGLRGPMFAGGNPFHLRRDHMRAGAGNHQHRYFFSRL